MNEQENFEIVPIIEIGTAYDSEGEKQDIITCKFLDGELTAPMVVAICLGVIDTFVKKVDENYQIEIEDAIFSTLNEERDRRHDYIDGIDYGDDEE